jgi:hypothetical protein
LTESTTPSSDSSASSSELNNPLSIDAPNSELNNPSSIESPGFSEVLANGESDSNEQVNENEGSSCAREAEPMDNQPPYVSDVPLL